MILWQRWFQRFCGYSQELRKKDGQLYHMPSMNGGPHAAAAAAAAAAAGPYAAAAAGGGAASPAAVPGPSQAIRA